MKRKTIRILLISSGFILILLVGYRLYLEYQTDIQLFLNPKASKCSTRDSNLGNWCDCRIEFWSLQRHTH